MGAVIHEGGSIGKLVVRLIRSGFSSKHYYKSMNMALYHLRDEYTMLHYPLYKDIDDDFHKAQENLTNHCMSYVLPIEGRSVLEIGCGNGVQTKFIQRSIAPALLPALTSAVQT